MRYAAAQPSAGCAPVSPSRLPAPGQVHSRKKQLLAAALILGISSLAFLAIRVGMQEYSVPALLVLRFGTASIAILFVWLLSPGRFFRRAPTRGDWPLLISLGLTGVILYNIGINLGQRSVSASTASLLINTVPLWTALLGIVWFRERLPSPAYLGLLIAAAGAAWISISEGRLSIEPAVLWILGAAVIQAVYIVLVQRAASAFGPLGATALTIWIASLVLWPLLPLVAGEIVRASPAALGAGLFLGVAASSLGPYLWAYLLTQMEAPRAASLFYLVPLLTALEEWTFFGDIPSWHLLAGGSLTFIGLLLMQKGRGKRPVSSARDPRPGEVGIRLPEGLESVQFRATSMADLEFVLAAERDPLTRPWIEGWSLGQHAAAIYDSDLAHWTLYTATRPVGFLILAGLERTDRRIELKRIVITEKSRGFGRVALQMVLAHAFEVQGALAVWLDVRPQNKVARHLYSSLGFRPASQQTDAELLVYELSAERWRCSNRKPQPDEPQSFGQESS